jgi:hypothetical protein
MTDAEIGLLDAMTTIMEILLALGIEPSVLEVPLRFQRDGQRAAGRVDAAVVLDILLDYVTRSRACTAARKSSTNSAGTTKGNGLRAIKGGRMFWFML